MEDKDKDKIKQRFELLKIARELLNEEYINRRAEDHNKWVADNELLWRTSRRNLPYPPFAQYPTDEELVRTASNLYNFIYMHNIIPDHDDTSIVDDHVQAAPDPVNPEYTPPEHAEQVEDNVARDSKISVGVKKLLPGWIRRSDAIE